MRKEIVKDAFGWGFLLWLIGYALGIVLFTMVPPSQIGWFLMPVGVALTLYVLIKKIKSVSFTYYLLLAAVWTLIAIVCDYVFLVRAFHPADGYYKFDVYVYYSLTFLLPIFVGAWKRRETKFDRTKD